MGNIENFEHRIKILQLELVDEKAAALHYQQQAVNIEAAAKTMVKTMYEQQSKLVTDLTEANLRIARQNTEILGLKERVKSGKT